ncbi:MAG: hypothetical protein JRJ24_04715, partial [Deltaproteobacteria bacterium]|nr:hypothetical protein [Deltaproteobacteria bacterium]
HRSGRFFNFNGTAGMWRKTAITDAGGWQHDTITEDMDLSYRAQLAGWKFVYAPEVSAPAELPCDMNSFKGQQYRWAKGSVQTARKLLGQILRAPVSPKVKTEAVFHLTNNLAYVFLLVLAALKLPKMLIRRHLEHPELLLLDVPLFLATCGSVAAFYVVAHHDLYGGRWQAIKRLPTGCRDVPRSLALAQHDRADLWRLLYGYAAPRDRHRELGECALSAPVLRWVHVCGRCERLRGVSL